MITEFNFITSKFCSISTLFKMKTLNNTFKTSVYKYKNIQTLKINKNSYVDLLSFDPWLFPFSE